METIDTKDLLIGSYVLGPVKKKNKIIMVVQSIVGGAVYCRNGNGHFYEGSLRFVEPIPITAGVLVRLGFKQSNNIKYELWQKEDGMDFIVVSATFINDKEIMATFGGGDETPFQIYVDSVHRLQALVWQLERVWLTLQPQFEPQP